LPVELFAGALARSDDAGVEPVGPAFVCAYATLVANSAAQVIRTVLVTIAILELMVHR
jgi:hypothetical protein